MAFSSFPGRRGDKEGSPSPAYKALVAFVRTHAIDDIDELVMTGEFEGAFAGIVPEPEETASQEGRRSPARPGDPANAVLAGVEAERPAKAADITDSADVVVILEDLIEAYEAKAQSAKTGSIYRVFEYFAAVLGLSHQELVAAMRKDAKERPDLQRWLEREALTRHG